MNGILDCHVPNAETADSRLLPTTNKGCFIGKMDMGLFYVMRRLRLIAQTPLGRPTLAQLPNVHSCSNFPLSGSFIACSRPGSTTRRRLLGLPTHPVYRSLRLGVLPTRQTRRVTFKPGVGVSGRIRSSTTLRERPKVAEWFSEGVSLPLEPIEEADHVADISAVLQRGNHKSATSAEDALVAMLQDEVEHGWQLILPPEAALQIPDAVVGSLGLVIQDTINERGEITDKQRLLHDQSYNPVRGTSRSVNNWVQRSELTPCRYGLDLRRYFHFILRLRRHILQTKVDWKAPNRRIHLAINLVVQSGVFIAGFLLLALRMTFGGSANPSRWSDVSELTCDLANAPGPGQTQVSPPRPDWRGR
jgi:hypothetical protein